MKEISLRLVIMSYLSDVQDKLSMVGKEEEIRQTINYIKILVSHLSEGKKEMTGKELDAIWETTTRVK